MTPRQLAAIQAPCHDEMDALKPQFRRVTAVGGSTFSSILTIDYVTPSEPHWHASVTVLDGRNVPRVLDRATSEAAIRHAQSLLVGVGQGSERLDESPTTVHLWRPLAQTELTQLPAAGRLGRVLN